MGVLSSVTGEVSGSKVAAVFDSEFEARAIARQVQRMFGFAPAQVQVVTPGDRRPGRKLEPEAHGIFRTIVIAHYRLGIAGLVLGVLAFMALYAAGIPAIVNSPALACAVITGFGGVAGLMLGGVVSLRPDHDLYVETVREALQDGRTAVVVHAFDAGQRERAEAALSAHGGETVRTL